MVFAVKKLHNIEEGHIYLKPYTRQSCYGAGIVKVDSITNQTVYFRTLVQFPIPLEAENHYGINHLLPKEYSVAIIGNVKFLSTFPKLS